MHGDCVLVHAHNKSSSIDCGARNSIRYPRKDHEEHLPTNHQVDVCLSESNLLPRLRKALSDLKGNRDLVIFKADNSDAVILMDMSHYVDLAWKHLSD